MKSEVKRLALRELLNQHVVLVQVNTKIPGVTLPPAQMDCHNLVLRLGYGLKPPIIGMGCDEDGLRATLTFKGTPFKCFVPWKAIYALQVDGSSDIAVFVGDVPQQAVEDMSMSDACLDGMPEDGTDKPEMSPPRGKLKLVH